MGKRKQFKNDPYLGAYLAVSIGAGVALGTALDNLAVGIAIGAGLWFFFGKIKPTFTKKHEKEDSSSKEQE